MGELDAALADVKSSLHPAADQDHSDMWRKVEGWFYFYMNMPTVNDDLSITYTHVNFNCDSRAAFKPATDHMKGQLDVAYGKLKGAYDRHFNSFKSIPKFLHTQSERWSDLAPKLATADEELRASKTAQNWIGAGAEAYLSTVPRQMAGMTDMANMANNAAMSLAGSASTMGGVYVWIWSAFEQLAGATQDLDTGGGAYARSTSLLYWLLDVSKELDNLASGVGQQWNVDMHGPITGMGGYLEQNSELREANTWPVAANLDGDFNPVAPNPAGAPAPYQPPATPPMQQPQGPPTTFQAPSDGMGGPLDLQQASGHKDTAEAGTTGL
ncbi:MAG: hypothetical protein GXX86_05015 [Propionibacterium sp.]|nr:hypothetical protein [Propionibacterium sp.]